MRLGSHMSEASRIKMSVASKKRWSNPEEHTKQSVVQMGNTNGSHPSEAARTRLSVLHLGNTINLGSHHSAITKAKLSAAAMGRTFSAETRAKISASKWRGGNQVTNARHTARRRLFGFVALNAGFPGCEGHHVDNEQVIYMPKALHRSVYHRQTDGQGMAQMNAIAYNFLFKQEVEAAIAAKEIL